MPAGISAQKATNINAPCAICAADTPEPLDTSEYLPAGFAGRKKEKISSC
jgi:hypothetical protein